MQKRKNLRFKCNIAIPLKRYFIRRRTFPQLPSFLTRRLHPTLSVDAPPLQNSGNGVDDADAKELQRQRR